MLTVIEIIMANAIKTLLYNDNSIIKTLDNVNEAAIDTDSCIRNDAKAALLLDASDVNEYCAEHLRLHASIVKRDATSHHANEAEFMARRLHGIADVPHLKYLYEKYDESKNVTMQDCMALRRSLAGHAPAKTMSTANAASTSGYCHKHLNAAHAWALCGLNPNTTDKAGRNRRRQRREAWRAKRSAAATAAAATSQATAHTAAPVPSGAINIDNTQLDSIVTAALARVLDAALVNSDTEYPTLVTNSDVAAIASAAEVVPRALPPVLIESAASEHMLPASIPLTDPVPKRVPIQLADNTITHSTEEGTATLPVSGGALRIKGLRVPAFRRALLSVAELAESFTLLFMVARMYIMPKTTIPPADAIATATMRQGTYIVNFAEERRTAAASLVTKGHHALHHTFNNGHTDRILALTTALPNLAQHLLDRLRYTETLPTRPEACQPCDIGKQTRAHFPAKDQEEVDALKPLDLLQTDTIDPIATPDIHGNRYLQLLIDAASRLKVGHILHNKSQVPHAILSTTKQWQMDWGSVVLRYHADNAKEKHAVALVTPLQAQGTRITTTAPYSSQKNGMVERALRHVFNIVRTALAAAGKSNVYWSYAAADAIYKENHMPRVGQILSPQQRFNKQQQPSIAQHFLPFGSHPKLQPRALPARYPRAPNAHPYLVLDTGTNAVKTIRNNEFKPTNNKVALQALVRHPALLQPDPKTIAEARRSPYASDYIRAYTAELRRHDTGLRTCTYVDPLPDDKPLPNIVNFTTKRNEHGGLDRFKARIATRGDFAKANRDHDPDHMASHMPSHALTCPHMRPADS